MKPGTDTLEAQAYRSRYDDGIIDLFVGLSLCWIGAAWLWIEPLAGVAGVFPAALAPIVGPLRSRILEPRVGYVRWGPVRVRWERRQLLLLVALGCAAFLLGVGGFLWARRAGGTLQPVASLPALLLAVPAAVLAVVGGIHRLWWYAALLTGAAAVSVAVTAHPGAPLLAAGAIVTVCGAVLLGRFLSRHPVR